MRKKYKRYGLTGLAYFGLWLLIDLLSLHPPLLATLVNSAWLAVYITSVNYLFFEWLGSRAWLYPPVIILLSAGLYGWRLLGIGLFIYTPLRSFSILAGVIYIAPHGLLSLLLFGLIKNQYEHRKLKRAVEQFELEKKVVVKDHIVIMVQKKKVKVLFADILYVESQREYVKIVTASQAYLPKMSTCEIETLLPARQFKRVHRSYIVALAHIDSYTAETIGIAGQVISVGRAYRDVIKTF